MAIGAAFDYQDDTLLVTASGSDESLEEVEKYLSSIIEEGHKYKVQNILCDERNLKYELGMADLFELGQLLSNHAKFINRVAIVCSPEYINETKFFENVTSNRGVSIIATTDIEEARSWIQ
jgi:hypothetical protein